MSKKEKSLLLIVILVVLIAAAIIIKNIITTETSVVNKYSLLGTKNYKASSEVGSVSMTEGEQDPNSLSYPVSGLVKPDGYMDDPWYMYTFGGLDYNCLEYGNTISDGESKLKDNHIEYEDALALDGQPLETPPHDCVYTEGHHDDGEFVGKQGIIYKVIAQGDLSPAYAYIKTSDLSTSFSADEQNAMWGLADKTTSVDGQTIDLDGGLMTSGDGRSSALGKEAEEYAKFDTRVRPEGMKPEDLTNYDDFWVKVNQTTGEYIAGPFTLNYVDGRTEIGKTFGGIQEMTIIGYDAGGGIIRDDIEIKAFIINDERVEPEYFEANELKVDETEQKYPEPEQEFEVVFDDPNKDGGEKIVRIGLKVKFQFMLANGKYSKMDGIYYYLDTECEDGAPGSCPLHSPPYDIELGGPGGEEGDHITCQGYYKLVEIPVQDESAVEACRTLYEQEFTIDTEEKGKIVMNLGGYVWEDGVANKESLADGVNNTTGEGIDKPLKNIKVTLYEDDYNPDSNSGTIAELAEGVSEDPSHCINPTATDEDGYYEFDGIDPQKKYVVVFEYNGQIYMPTEYMSTGGSIESMYNTEEWKITSKATESQSRRNAFDQQFAEIGSAPKNYPTSGSLGVGIDGYNEAFSYYELLGFELNENGDYVRSGEQLLDGFYDVQDGVIVETDAFFEGELGRAISSIVESGGELPDNLASLVSGDAETMRKLQFIQDCMIQAYTGSGSVDTYPVYDEFYLNEISEGQYNMDTITVEGTEYKPIYPGQYYINLGLWRRHEFDAALRKDAYKVGLKINGKTEVYKYDKRTTDDGYWDINIRVSDYDNYYNVGYNRELYRDDYEYTSALTNQSGKDLELYVTYKITVRNQSQSVMTQITEVVDYYDTELTYMEDLSWVMYKDDASSSNEQIRVTDDEYFDLIHTLDINSIEHARDVNSADDSRYGTDTNSDLEGEFGSVYVRGLENKKLATGESAYIYLTFKVNNGSNNKPILDENDDGKQNLAEINGFRTFYRDGTQLPNGISKGSGDTPGLVDRDSNPGNLESSDLQGERFEHNFEDDTDRAPSVRFIIDPDAVRVINGTAWEDERTHTSGDSIIGDGVRQDDEIGIAGVTIDLVEKLEDGGEYIWQTVKTGENGRYEIRNYIPGNYILRFRYGTNKETTYTTTTGIEGGSNQISYNGQDFKTTPYQKDMDNNQTIEPVSEITNVSRVDYSQRDENGNYVYYDIKASDAFGSNVSDVRDVWERREAVNNYSTNNVTNHIAEVLASPYIRPSYNGNSYTDEELEALLQELIDNTGMTAETGIIIVEFEYNRQDTDGDDGVSNGSDDYRYGNDYNGIYVLNNIDIGLTERPKSQLEISKQILNVRLTLANGNVLFDATKSADNVLWRPGEEYNLSEDIENGKYEEYYKEDGKHRYSYRDETLKRIDELYNDTNGLIQLTMDEELMHGATIRITYKTKIKNVGEVDYNSKDYYYRGEPNGEVVTTTANTVIDYVGNNLQFTASENGGWVAIDDEQLVDTGLINSDLSANASRFNTIVQTGDFATALQPEQEVEKQIILTQLITPENEQDDLTYDNMVEIVQTSNTVGRRMAFSVVGNQDPLASKPSEVDTAMAERVIILPPFGSQTVYYGLIAVVAVLLIAGIIIIKKKVLKK